MQVHHATDCDLEGWCLQIIYENFLLFHLVKLCNSAAAQGVVKLEGIKCCNVSVLKSQF